jgi:2-dehydro-3-deoxyglucarate aldolase
MKPQIGTWLTLPDISIAEIVADTNLDWICIDIEHSTITFDQVKSLIIAIQGKNKFVYVRVSNNDRTVIKRILDAGANGIIVPMVNTVKEAEEAINSVKYPPIGKRGVGLARAQDYGFGFENYRDNIANNIKLIVQIEHYIGIDNLEEIIKLDGIDGTFIGPYDLSGSLGKPGDYDSENVKHYLSLYEEIALKHTKYIGYHVVPPDTKLLQDKIDKGYNFLAFSFDAMFLGTIIREKLKEINR